MTKIFVNSVQNLLITILSIILITGFSSNLFGQVPKLNENLKPLKSVKVNGVKLHYHEKGKGTPVIFVHGGLEDYRIWESQIKPFSENYRVIAYSRRYNFPNDNSPIRSDHSAIVEAEDLAAMIKKLKLKPAHIVGHSYGAFTALFLAVKHPEMVRTLVLSEPPVYGLAKEKSEGKVLYDEFMNNVWNPAGNAFKKNENEQALRLTVRYFAGADVFYQAPETLREYWKANSKEWQALTTSTDAFPELPREDIKKIKAPVLMLSGENTLNILKFVDNKLQPLFVKGERVIFKKASHDMWSEQPGMVRQTVLTFLAKPCVQLKNKCSKKLNPVK